MIKVEQKKRPAPSPKVAPGSGKKAKQATPANKSGVIYISCFISLMFTFSMECQYTKLGRSLTPFIFSSGDKKGPATPFAKQNGKPAFNGNNKPKTQSPKSGGQFSGNKSNNKYVQQTPQSPVPLSYTAPLSGND